MSEKIITLGPKFSYSYNTSVKYHKEEKIILTNTITEVFKKIKGKTHGIVPIENMLNGSVRETFLELQKENICIFKAFDYKIYHIIAAQNKNFTTIMSHPQALIQCSKYIDKLRKKKIKIIETTSSSQAMKNAQKDDRIAAIGSIEAAKYYKLKIQKKNISNKSDNITRFIEIGKDKLSTKGNKTSLIISPKTDRSGLLFEILAVFKIKELNLTKIESIVTGKKMNSYMFYMDIEASLQEKKMKDTIEFLKTFVEVSILGSYDIECSL